MFIASGKLASGVTFMKVSLTGTVLSVVWLFWGDRRSRLCLGKQNRAFKKAPYIHQSIFWKMPSAFQKTEYRIPAFLYRHLKAVRHTELAKGNKLKLSNMP